MADVTAQLQQWAFEKQPHNPDSSASSPQLCHAESETLNVDTAVSAQPSPESTKSLELQQRYLSSEEDLSPLEGCESGSECDDDDVEIVSLHDGQDDTRKMTIARFNGKSGDMAVMVSYVSAGRAKVIDLALPPPTTRSDLPQRSASLAALPVTAIDRLKKLGQANRASLAAAPSSTRSLSPAHSSREPRRPSTGHARIPSLRRSDTSSFTTASTRSTSPAVSTTSDAPTALPSRPASIAAPRRLTLGRSSLFLSSSQAPPVPQTRPFPPLTPLSSERSHSFLSSDPYESANSSAASPIIKSSSPHKRLRSISQKLSLAKIAISPSTSTKKWDSRIHGSARLPPTPKTPFSPMTPMSAPVGVGFGAFPASKRRDSRLGRSGSREGEKSVGLGLTTSATSMGMKQKLVPRGADERAPILELPDFPDEMEAKAEKSRRLRKRKSLMSLITQDS
ncbi:hypothetical protein M011DRAFT_405279 [Sporormia fimetaria CBS 119925]|uniref:Uncharacterized protein n=1 Tax=Sporormia fimetaria CBS 119925 TaxID=1340428 RepID=A0A6A6V6D2_9PLEO|nr:hypothetical protein M011DRAFT_405279 [Sporormia fimetaria CBS 119925]